MPDKICDLPVFGGTIYSPELFSDPNNNVESDETTLCDNISNTLIEKRHILLYLYFTHLKNNKK
jgi:hypothetical protein